jgi:hypothetical protein
MDNEEREPWRDAYQNTFAAMRMIIETIGTLALGALPSNEAVLMLYGPEPIHEGRHCRRPHTMTTRQVTAKRKPIKESKIVLGEARSSVSTILVAAAEIDSAMGVFFR